MLSILLPTKQEIRSDLEAILDVAVDIANIMTREKALFVCKLIPAGAIVDDKCMNVSDEDQKGRVFMCAFPKFCKRIIHEGHKRNLYLVKADVELESGFQVQ